VTTSIAPTFVGLDVHKDSITFALLRPGSDVPEQDKIPNTPEAVRKLARQWKDPAGIRACYEAGPCGYGLQRLLASLGVDCSVIAPSLTPRRPGERIKTDRRDARKLARFFRAGELSCVRVPAPEEEAVRDLVRFHEDLGEDVLRARHRLSKLLLRHDRIWPATAWTKAHMEWIRRQRFELPVLQRTLDEHIAALEMRLAQRELLAREILEIAARPPYQQPVARLAALRGIQALSALTLVVEVGDFARFGSAEDLMAFTGLVPSEDSSGEERRRGHITKTGNAHLRRILVEAAWAYAARPGRGRKRMARLEGQPPDVVALALASEERLHRRYWRIVRRGKLTQVAAVAVARELAGAVWALMRGQVVA
jgi:transposase